MTDTTTLALEISGYIEKNFLFNARRLDPAEPLLAGGVIDSTGIMELLGFLEERYGVTFRDDELVGENFESVQRIADFILPKLAR